jgi:hypothetical protein
VQFVFDIQSSIVLVASLALFAIKAWAFVDSVSHKPEVFEAAGKQTKTMWMVLLGVALAAQMLLWHPINLINLIGTVAAIVYLVDVRPAVRSMTRR